MNDSTPSSPYPGLRPFRREEARYFFGRQTQISELVRRLVRQNFVAVVGPSGSGKSSLVLAGLFPTLELGYPTAAGDSWLTVEMNPGTSPRQRLSEALWGSTGGGSGADRELDRALLHAALCRGPEGIVDLYRRGDLPRDQNLLLLVDQFEEIFRFRERDADEAHAFVDLLLRTAEAEDLPIYIVLTMRFDFLRDCAVFGGLPEKLNETQYLIPRLEHEELIEAITKPAAAFAERPGSRVTAELANRLANDLGPEVDQLPVLQHFLMRLWTVEAAKAVDPHSPLRLDTARADQLIGGALEPGLERLGRVLSDHADEAYEEVPEALRPLARRVFQVLTERRSGERDIRRRLPFAAVVAIVGLDPRKPRQQKKVESAIAPFLARDFLTLTDGELNIGHETLIWHWKRLAQWVGEEADSAAIYRRLRDSVARYPKGVLVYPELDAVLAWKKTEKPNPHWAALYLDQEERQEDSEADLEIATTALGSGLAYLERSRRRRDLRKLLRWAVPAAIVLAAALALLYFSFRLEGIRQEGESAREEAVLARAQLQSAVQQQREAAESVVQARAAEAAAEEELRRTRAEIEAAREELEEVKSGARKSIEEAEEARNQADVATEEARDAQAETRAERKRTEDAIEANRETEARLRERYENQLTNAVQLANDRDNPNLLQARTIVETISGDEDLVAGSRRRARRALQGMIEAVSGVPSGTTLQSRVNGELTGLAFPGIGKAVIASSEPRFNFFDFADPEKRLPSKTAVVEIFDAATGELMDTWSDEQLDGLSGLALDAAGKLWVSSGDGRVGRFDLDELGLKNAFKAGEASFGLDFAPATELYRDLHPAPFLANAATVVRLIDPASGQTLRELKRQFWSQLVQQYKGKRFIDVAFQHVSAQDPDGKEFGPLVAAAAEDQVITWELKKNLRVDDTDHLDDLHTAVAFHPSKPYLAAAGPDNQAVLIFDPEYGFEGRQQRVIFEHPASVTDLAFFDRGQQLITASEDGRLRAWTWSAGQRLGHLLRLLEPGVERPAIRQLVVDDMADLIYSLDATGTVRTYYDGRRQQLYDLPELLGAVDQIVLAPDLDRVALLDETDSGHRIQLIDLVSQVRRAREVEGAPELVFDRFGNLEALTAAQLVEVRSVAPETRLSAEPKQTFDAPEGQTAIAALRLADDGLLVATVEESSGTRLRVWAVEPESGRREILTRRFPAHEIGARFSDDGRSLLVHRQDRPGQDIDLEIFPLGGRFPSLSFRSFLRGSAVAVLSPSAGRVALVGTDDLEQIYIQSWRPTEGEAVADGRPIWVEEREVPPGMETEPEGAEPPDPILDADFGPDDNLLATLGRDGFLRLWDLDKGIELFSHRLPAPPAATAEAGTGALDFACSQLTENPSFLDCAIAIALPPERLVVYRLGQFEIDG